MANNLLPPLPNGVAPGSFFWNDWYEKLRTLVNFISSNINSLQTKSEKNQANGYAGLNTVSRITVGVDTVDDVIIDNTNKGLVLKSPGGIYFRASISNVGLLSWTNLGTSKP